LGESCLAAVVPQTILKDVAALFQAGTLVGLPDRVLVERFLEGPGEQSEAAFSALVDRHGPMVLRVCRQILGNVHDAEDAGQAAFLLLARKSHSIRGMDSVAGWLCGAAVRVANRSRRDLARRRRHELEKAGRAIEQSCINSEHGGERWPELYEELGRLPDRYRLPVLFCHLEGLSYEQAAERLGCPVRTVHSRLSRAKMRLRDRLARRGVRPAIAVLSAAFAQNGLIAKAGASETWKQATVSAAVGRSAGVLSSAVILLADGVSKTMNAQFAMKCAAALLSVGIAAGGAGMGMLAWSGSP
jgi:RNA polymerase sigma factor (sigma-70 family)